MRHAGTRLLSLVLILTILTASLPALGQGYTEAERETLFWASHRFAQEKEALPRRHMALFTTNVGTDGSTPVNWGGKVEAGLTDGFWVSLEVIHLGDDGLDGFTSVKVYPGRRTLPVYVGAGLALGNALGSQVFAGVELLNHFYVELKYVRGGKAGDGTPYVAAGYNLSF